MSNGDRSGRRSFLSRVGVAAGAIAVVVPERALARETLGQLTGASETMAPFALRPAERIGRWTVVEVHPVRFGAVPVILADGDGEQFQIDVLRRDGHPDAPVGVGQTDTLSVYLSNRGDGDTATREEHGLGALALAAALDRREAQIPDGLLTFAERAAMHPRAAYSVPLPRA
jgi:hypothetical protein